jgi:hypothetical protein
LSFVPLLSPATVFQCLKPFIWNESSNMNNYLRILFVFFYLVRMKTFSYRCSNNFETLKLSHLRLFIQKFIFFTKFASVFSCFFFLLSRFDEWYLYFI